MLRSTAVVWLRRFAHDAFVARFVNATLYCCNRTLFATCGRSDESARHQCYCTSNQTLLPYLCKHTLGCLDGLHLAMVAFHKQLCFNAECLKYCDKLQRCWNLIFRSEGTQLATALRLYRSHFAFTSLQKVAVCGGSNTITKRVARQLITTT